MRVHDRLEIEQPKSGADVLLDEITLFIDFISGKRQLRERCRASPVLARSLFTVLAAISLARLVDAPRFFALSLMCSYWRSRLLLQAS